MDTTTDPVPPLLRLLWLASPALPIGAFSYSEALEAAVEHGLVVNDVSAADWLSQQLMLLARGDLAAIAQGIDAWRASDEATLRALADWLCQTRDGAEARLQSEQTGQSLLAWLRPQGMASSAQLAMLQRVSTPLTVPSIATTSTSTSTSTSTRVSPADPGPAGMPRSTPHYPLVMALALSTIDLPAPTLLQAQAFGWAENQVQAALKAVPLGQTAGQRVLARLAADIPAAVAAAIATPPARRQVFAPRWSILAARHETQYSRLFRS